MALWMFSLVPHAAGVESLFSQMAAVKTKSKNRMSTKTLTMRTQVKGHLRQKWGLAFKRREPRDPTMPMGSANFELMEIFDDILGEDSGGGTTF